jgi:hypothetical protein
MAELEAALAARVAGVISLVRWDRPSAPLSTAPGRLSPGTSEFSLQLAILRPNAMTITYENIMPWGRSFEEYRRMFDLQDLDLERVIFGCGDGPAAFNAGMRKRGHRVTSADPLYHFPRKLIEQRIAEIYDVVIEQTRSNHHLFRWVEPIDSVDALGRTRMAAMQDFLDDYEQGLAEKRYVDAELPMLPFADASFDLVLCSHFLFLYSDQLDLEFHVRAVGEMLRVGNEVRIFPIVDCSAQISPHLEPVMTQFSRDNEVERVTVKYEFQIGGNQMLVIRRRT